MSYKPIFEQQILVGTTIVTLTTSYYEKAERCFITLRNSAITFKLTASPTTDEGHNLNAGSDLTLYGYGEMAGFRAVGATTCTGSTGARMWVTYSGR